MDLSNNKFAGDLPKSFGSLTNLTELFLENNNFTGSVIYLAELPLSYLNLEGSQFSGRIPRQFQSIQNLWFWGNRFDTVAIYPPWNFPLDSDPHEQNISSPPSSQQSAMVDYPSSETSKRKKKRLSPLGLSSVVVGAAAVAICVAVFFVIHIKRSNAKKLESLDSSVSTHHSHIISPSIGENSTFCIDENWGNQLYLSHLLVIIKPFLFRPHMSIDFSTAAQTASLPFANISSAFNLAPRRNPSVLPNNTENTARRKSFAG